MSDRVLRIERTYLVRVVQTYDVPAEGIDRHDLHAHDEEIVEGVLVTDGTETIDDDELQLRVIEERDAEALDVWLRIPEGEEEAEAEANTYKTATGYRVDWSLTAVGLIKSRQFTTIDETHAWLTSEGFANYTA